MGATKARRAMIRRLTDAIIEYHDNLSCVAMDREYVELTVDRLIPETYDEFEEAYEQAERAAFGEQQERPACSSLSDLREALGLGKEIPIIEVVKAATERIQACAGSEHDGSRGSEPDV